MADNEKPLDNAIEWAKDLKNAHKRDKWLRFQLAVMIWNMERMREIYEKIKKSNTRQYGE